jgi:hypothetical protein
MQGINSIASFQFQYLFYSSLPEPAKHEHKNGLLLFNLIEYIGYRKSLEFEN